MEIDIKWKWIYNFNNLNIYIIIFILIKLYTSDELLTLKTLIINKELIDIVIYVFIRNN